jgi:hypothetical protein
MSEPIIVCMPMRDRMTSETAQALRDNMDGFATTLLTEVGKPVREARNALARRVTELGAGGDALVLWSDDDAWWPGRTVLGMIARLPPDAVLFGLHSVRFPWSQPSAIRADQQAWSDDMTLHQGGFWICRGPLRDQGDVVGVLAASTHFFIHRARLFEGWDEPFSVHPLVRQRLAGVLGNVVDQLTDDASFCLNMLNAGIGLYVDAAAPVAHIEADSGAAFLPLRAILRVRGNGLVPLEGVVDPGKDRSYGLQAYDGGRSRLEMLDFLERTSALFMLEAERLQLMPKPPHPRF